MADNAHPYVPATPTDSRSPCPGLNTLANHGYLPHDGRSISSSELIAVLREVYNISEPLAMFFTGVAEAACGRWTLHPSPGRVLDLHALARHNVLEHDGSLVHDDAPLPTSQYAPTPVDRTLLKRLLDHAPQGSDALRLVDLCRAQVERERASRKGKLNAVHGLLAEGEIGLIYTVFGVPRQGGSESDDGTNPAGSGCPLQADSEKGPPAEEDVVNDGPKPAGSGCPLKADPENAVGEEDMVIPKRFLEVWLGEERLPEGWQRPAQAVGHPVLSAAVKTIGTLEEGLRKQ